MEDGPPLGDRAGACPCPLAIDGIERDGTTTIGGIMDTIVSTVTVIMMPEITTTLGDTTTIGVHLITEIAAMSLFTMDVLANHVGLREDGEAHEILPSPMGVATLEGQEEQLS
jgi:hypothetical protein